MFVIELTYLKPLEEVEKHLEAHRDYLQKYYDEGLLLASGPKVPREGGVIIAVTTDKEKVTSLVNEDPFYQQKIADYRVLQFNPVKCADSIKSFLRA